LIFAFILNYHSDFCQTGVNNLIFSLGTPTLTEGSLGEIKKMGKGPIQMILIADAGFSWDIYKEFMEKNRRRYTMYAIVIPGSVHTLPLPMPPEGTSYGKRTWLENIKKGVLLLIDSLHLTKTVLVGNLAIASWLALNIALEHPDKISSVVIVGGTPFVSWPSPKDPSGKTPVSMEERIPGTDQYMAPKFFKSMSAKTWKGNLYQVAQYTNDSARGEKYFDETAQTPVPVMVRYLCEYYTTNVSEDFANMKVPVLVLIPGFSENYFRRFTSFQSKKYFWESWEKAKINPLFQFEKISGARILVLNDQFKYVNRLILEFLRYGHT
jgi:pimeloyl-ACP methyl ester carboxylesterase